MAENFLTHKLGELPVWGWGLAGIGGIGIAFFVIKSRNAPQTAIPTGMQASTTTTGNVLPDQTGYAQQAGQITPGAPFPTVPGTGGSQVPVFPGPGWTPILDGQGNVIGWNPPPTPGTQPSGTKTVMVRAKGANPGYDVKFPGPPVRPGPGASTGLRGTVPWGSALQVLPTVVTGKGNYSDTSGITTWYQLQGGGYISTYDVVG